MTERSSVATLLKALRAKREEALAAAYRERDEKGVASVETIMRVRKIELIGKSIVALIEAEKVAA